MRIVVPVMLNLFQHLPLFFHKILKQILNQVQYKVQDDRNMKTGYVYITTNKPGGTLYIGVTSDLVQRISEHKQVIDEKSFTAKYNCKKLVYYENCDNIETAIKREKQLKNWHRDWKIKLIETMNPNWDDLYEQITQ